ncbi:MAG: hypothetical protein JWM88_3410 [Verrucomicrobia bacterium]|nr:hypothetical protein [Verrucomicrobiota bacterium]
MSDASVPPPDFDHSRYERPNKDWICGNTADGCPCRIGPSPRGECRATTECKPQLILQEGEEKGTWKCTRPKEWGGACAQGPQPDGTCCNAIPKCRPSRSLRNRRGLVVRAVIAASVGGLIIALTGAQRDRFINPAPLSARHTGPEFVRMAAGLPGPTGEGCVACHREINSGVSRWGKDAIRAGRTSLRFANLVSTHPKDFSQIDPSCLSCHRASSFHQPDIAREISCSGCHLEHQGPGPMPRVAMERCADCHGDAEQMAAAAARGRAMPAARFAKAAMPGVVLFPRERPAEGFTRVIHSFATDHPEFRVNQPGMRDRNPLLFNHAVHLAGDIPLLNGKPLECASCHQPDTSGAFMQRVTFEQNCRACHSLQFDERNPGMQLPHGDSAYVRAYLRSLPAQYADYAAAKLGITGRTEQQKFVDQQMRSLREKTRSGELLEEQVFFSDAKQGPVSGVAGLDRSGRAKFAGCAYCHEVTARGSAAPEITPPVMPDRWLPHAQFNHSAHTQVHCTTCHAAARSQATSDIIMPTQQSCVECHGPKGGVNAGCSECHSYHNPPPAGWRPPTTQ